MIRRASLLILLSVSSFAFGTVNPSCSGFEFSAEWLYMQNVENRPYYAEQLNPDTGTGSGRRFANQQGWHSGYRLDGIYKPCTTSAWDLRWTHFPELSNSASTPTFATDSLIAILLPFSQNNVVNFAQVKDSFKYHSLELSYAQALFGCDPFVFWLEGGIHYANIRFHENALYTATDGSFLDLQYFTKFVGVGPEVGMTFEYKLCTCLTAEMRAQAGLLASRKHDSFDINAAGSFVGGVLDVEPFWGITPVFNIRLGLNYAYPCQFYCLNIELGYEFLSYPHALERIEDVDTYQLSSSIDFKLHGPYVLLGVCF